jgi:two-component system response regulator AtoC
MRKILIIDDDSSIRKTMEKHLQNENTEIRTAGDSISGRKIWSEFRPNIILLDLGLPDGDGMALLEDANSTGLGGLVVIITGAVDMEKAVLAMRIGAYDYLMKPLDIEQIDTVMERASASCEIAPQPFMNLKVEEEYFEGRIVGISPAILEVHKQIGLAARCYANVLIRGETGTGKELVAKAIHRNSLSKGLFIAVNCSAIVPTLMESELFGHEKGSFTGAYASKVGQFELAKNGTIFLDEIGDLQLDMQVKLLRVLQEREFKLVGGTVSIPLKSRIIAATHRNLETMVDKGEFRQDLYYRLKVLEINIPPLRERREDIIPLMRSLLYKINQQVHRNITKVPESALQSLKAYNWPGNIRELENVLTTSVINSPGEMLELKLPSSIPKAEEKSLISTQEQDFHWQQTLEEVEKQHIRKVLEKVEGHFGKACEILGISRPTLRKKIKDYGLQASFNEE